MRPTAVLLTLCCLAVRTHGGPSPDFCSQVQNMGVKPGFPKAINTNNPGVLRAARNSVEKFNNCTDDIFLFKEAHVGRALVQVVKGLKYILEVEICRTMCRKTTHTHLDDCDFQTSPDLKRRLSCYSEVWVIPWLRRVQVPVLHCHALPPVTRHAIPSPSARWGARGSLQSSWKGGRLRRLLLESASLKLQAVVERLSTGPWTDAGCPWSCLHWAPARPEHL